MAIHTDYNALIPPNINVLMEKISPLGYKLGYICEYYLPDLDMEINLSCAYDTKILHQQDFKELYVKQWSHALCEDRKELDVLGVGAYDNGQLIGLAACSADCEEMWQIGIDVLPQYRGKGLASYLTRELMLEIIKKGKVPFYAHVWSNIASKKNALKSGFQPAWNQLVINK